MVGLPLMEKWVSQHIEWQGVVCHVVSCKAWPLKRLQVNTAHVLHPPAIGEEDHSKLDQMTLSNSAATSQIEILQTLPPPEDDRHILPNGQEQQSTREVEEDDEEDQGEVEVVYTGEDDEEEDDDDEEDAMDEGYGRTGQQDE